MDPGAARLWHRYFAGQACVVCEADPPPPDLVRALAEDFRYVEGHHVISKAELKRWGLHALIWDLRNGVALCRHHHGAHESGRRRLPRHLIPQPAWEFAAEINATFVLEDDRVYPLAA